MNYCPTQQGMLSTRSTKVPSLAEFALSYITAEEEVPFMVLTTILQQRPKVTPIELQTELTKRKRKHASIQIKDIEVARILGDALNIFYECETTTLVPNYLLAEISKRNFCCGEFFAFDIPTYIHEGIYYKVWPDALDADIFAFVVYRGLFHFVILNQVWGMYISEPSDDDMYNYDRMFVEKTLSGKVIPTVKHAMMVGI